MRKYVLRYLVFWAPAFLTACFYNNPSMPSQVLQWFFAFFLLLGWFVNTAMSTYQFPRKTLSLLLMYMGANLLLIVALYRFNAGGERGLLFLRLAGILSFTPLDIFVVALLDFNIPHEIYITVGLVVICFFGWLLGLLYRRLHPNPYRPTIRS